mmetsp:Transcript_18727/g.39812  ORF Transcript_18727/g.39812 Transcript_18727/m.39812 type:complete len:225 (+) Transcript_18727:454-1128(+)
MDGWRGMDAECLPSLLGGLPTWSGLYRSAEGHRGRRPGAAGISSCCCRGVHTRSNGCGASGPRGPGVCGRCAVACGRLFGRVPGCYASLAADVICGRERGQNLAAAAATEKGARAPHGAVAELPARGVAGCDILVRGTARGGPGVSLRAPPASRQLAWGIALDGGGLARGGCHLLEAVGATGVGVEVGFVSWKTCAAAFLLAGRSHGHRTALGRLRADGAEGWL